MPLPVLQAIKRYINPNPDQIIKEAFRFKNKIYAGVQVGCWEQDELAWDNDDLGAWLGPAPVLAVPKDLRFAGSTEVLTNDGDPVAVLASGAPVIAVWDVLDRTNSLSNANGNTAKYEYYLYDINRQIVDHAVVPLTPTAQGVFSLNSTPPIKDTRINPQGAIIPDGSYLFWVHFKDVAPPYRLPAGYTLNRKYVYKENDVEYVYDPYFNIGRVPSDVDHPLRSLRRSIKLENKQTDRADWASYLTSAYLGETEWSCLRLQIGGGEWTIGVSNQILSPGPSLLHVTSPSTSTKISFDHSARSTSASRYLRRDVKDKSGNIVIPKGTMLFSGNRTTRSGPLLALWGLYNNETYKLLGMNTNPSTGFCECALEDHSATDIFQTEGGKVYVLTKCSLHAFDPNGRNIEESLPGVPEESQGHPGGSCLRTIGPNLYFFTEYFGGDTRGRLHFYNSIVQQQGQIRTMGPGTVFHGHNCGDLFMGRLWGIYQDLPFSDELAKQFITYYDGADWAFKPAIDSTGKPIPNSSEPASLLSFLASEFRWQRMANCQSPTQGEVLTVYGKHPDQENDNGDLITLNDALFGVGDGQTFRRLHFPYRIRKAIRTFPATGDEGEPLLVIGREVIGNDITDTWQIVEINGDEIPIDYVYDGTDKFCCPETDVVKAGLTVANLPPYLYYAKEWYPSKIRPTAADVFYLEKNYANGTVCYSIPTGNTLDRPYLFEECPVIRYYPSRNEYIIGHYDAGKFVICACKNAWECITDSLPVGSKWQVITLPRQSDPINAIQVVDRMIDLELTEHRKKWRTLWCRIDSEIDYDNDDEEYLSTFNRILDYNCFEKLFSTTYDKVDIVVLVPPEPYTNENGVDLPVVVRRN